MTRDELHLKVVRWINIIHRTLIFELSCLVIHGKCFHEYSVLVRVCYMCRGYWTNFYFVLVCYVICHKYKDPLREYH